MSGLGVASDSSCHLSHNTQLRVGVPRLKPSETLQMVISSQSTGITIYLLRKHAQISMMAKFFEKFPAAMGRYGYDKSAKSRWVETYFVDLVNLDIKHLSIFSISTVSLMLPNLI